MMNVKMMTAVIASMVLIMNLIIKLLTILTLNSMAKKTIHRKSDFISKRIWSYKRRIVSYRRKTKNCETKFVFWRVCVVMLYDMILTLPLPLLHLPMGPLPLLLFS
jgi:hypothetical protein